MPLAALWYYAEFRVGGIGLNFLTALEIRASWHCNVLACFGVIIFKFHYHAGACVGQRRRV